MHSAIRQAPDQPAIDRTGEHIAAPGALGEFAILQQQFEFRRREIRIDDQAGEFSDAIRLGRQFRATRRGAPVLPDDGRPHRATGPAIPENDGLALVRNSDGARRQLRLLDGFAPGGHRPLENFFRIVLDPARPRVVLGDLSVSSTRDPPVFGDDEAGGAGGSLVNGED
jgi:hypothetical protein